MKKIRRVVTGHHPNGKSVIASDQEVEGADVPGLPGATLTTLWGADETLSYPDDGTEPKHHAWFPPVGGFRFAAFVLVGLVAVHIAEVLRHQLVERDGEMARMWPPVGGGSGGET